LANVLKADVSVPVKIHASLHLLVGVVFVCALVCSVLSVPLLLLKKEVPHLRDLYTYTSFSLVTLIFLSVFHYVATVYTQSAREENARRYFWRTFPFYMCFSMGISLHNAVAVLEGWLGVKSSFVRTPKFNVGDSRKGMLPNVYRVVKLSPLHFAELGMMFYFLGGAALGVMLGDYTMLPYHLMLAFGFGMVCYFALAEMKGISPDQLQLGFKRTPPSLSGPIVHSAAEQ
jgi:hypothetical protein